jgi:D-alanyl-D-alanine carboxypeptidase (penicillin-binding protein 5/6)
MMKRRLKSLISVLLIILLFGSRAYASESIPFKLYSDAALVMDMNDGTVLYSKNATEQRYPASTTKMLTCIVALENMDLGTTVTVDADSAAIGGNSLKLKEGEKLNAKDLLYSTMVISANDGASVIAKAVSGNTEEFVKLMNRKAVEIGCTGSNFVNPHGLHDDNHYSTAYDLAKIAMYCMQNPVFREIVRNESYTVPATNLNEQRILDSTNWLLYDTVDSHRVYVGNDYRYCKYDGCIGIKTGQTAKAGSCMVAAATKGETSILAVSLNAANVYERFSDSIALLDLGFANYETSKIMAMNSDMGVLKVKRGAVKSVPLTLDGDVRITLQSGEKISSLTTEAAISQSALTAPVEAGVVVGTLNVYKNGNPIKSVNIVTAESVSKGGILSVFGISDAEAAKIGRVFKTIFIILLILVVAFVVWVFYEKEQVKKKKARRAARLKAKQEREKLERKKIERMNRER